LEARSCSSSGANHRTREVSLDPLRWGLIPHWPATRDRAGEMAAPAAAPSSQPAIRLPSTASIAGAASPVSWTMDDGRLYMSNSAADPRAMLMPVKTWPGDTGASRTVIATASLDGPCARRAGRTQAGAKERPLAANKGTERTRRSPMT